MDGILSLNKIITVPLTEQSEPNALIQLGQQLFQNR